MSVQPDIIWNEQCLGIRIGEQVCIYLKKHNAEYHLFYILHFQNYFTHFPLPPFFFLPGLVMYPREVSSDRNIYGSGSVNQSDSRRTSGTAPIFPTGERKGNDRRRISFLYGTGTDDFVWCHAWKNQKSSVRKGRK